MIKLKASNQPTWKIKMEDLLYCNDFYEAVEGDKSKSGDMKDDNWKKLNKKCMGLIQRWVDELVFHHIDNEINAQSLWNKLESFYKRENKEQDFFKLRNL